MKNLTLFLISSSILTLLLGAHLDAVGDCPECYKNAKAMTGSGPASDGSTRREIKVRIDASLEDTPGHTKENVWNGVQGCSGCPGPGALAMWNNTTTGYHLKLDQSSQNPDIIIQFRAKLPDNALAMSGQRRDAKGNLLESKRVVILGPEVLSWTQQDLQAAIAHEIGHLFGLADQYGTTGCATVMNQAGSTTHRPLTKTVQSNDVQMVNKHFADKNQCTRTRPSATTLGTSQSPSPTPTPSECTDNDHDGICVQFDCDDNNFWSSYDFDGDGFCNGNDCNDYDAQIHPGALLDPNTEGDEDRNCNGQDDLDEQGFGPCGWQTEQQCRAAGKNWEASHCTCSFYSDPSPIVIDVLGDGFNLTDFKNGVQFDLNNDGVKERLSWTSVNSDDSWLVLDRNGNGLVDNGSELFGNFTPQPTPPVGKERNGFLALLELDKPANGGNKDGVITRQDSIFRSLLLWQDVNHNGASEFAELFPLDSVGLKKIELNYKNSKRVDSHGNEFRYRAKVKDSQDAQLGRWAWDVFLVNHP